MGNDFDPFGDIQQSARKKTPGKGTPEALKKEDERSRVLSIRFPRDDLKKLTDYFKVEYGETSVSRIFRKIVFEWMRGKGIL
jgi:transposase